MVMGENRETWEFLDYRENWENMDTKCIGKIGNIREIRQLEIMVNV